ncbi:MAG: pilus assembly protein [Caulobacteraceae bacterium]|nr:pilus assembly protein [Caulobacteraceae bacterium]
MLDLFDLSKVIALSRGPRPRRSVAVWALAADTRGVAALELSLALPFMMLLMMGIFDFGSFAYETMEVHAAAYAGAEAAVAAAQNSQPCTTTLITSAETSATPLGSGIQTSGTGPGKAANCSYTGYVNTSGGTSTLSTTCSATCAASGTYAVSYAQASFSPVLSWTGLVLPSTISTTATVRYQ